MNSLNSLLRHVVFVMITSDLDKVPGSAVSQSQIYQYPMIKEVDIANRLEKICTQEGLDFDQAILKFVASKSDGSLRDAEMMLDQLSFLYKKITMTLVHELGSRRLMFRIWNYRVRPLIQNCNRIFLCCFAY